MIVGASLGGVREALVAWLVALVWLLLSHACLAETVISEPAYDLHLTLPDGYDRVLEHAIPEEARQEDFQSVVYFSNDSACSVIVAVKKKTVRRRLVKVRHYDDGLEGDAFPCVWQGYRVNAFRIFPRAVKGEVQQIYLMAEVPLQRQGIEIWLTGPLSQVEQLHTDLDEVVASVTGECSWSPYWRDDWGEPLSGHPLALIATYLGLLVIGLGIVWRRAHRWPLSNMMAQVGGGLVMALLAGLTGIFELVLLGVMLGSLALLTPLAYLWSQAEGSRSVEVKKIRHRGPFV